jgi:hypothetical protein
VFCDILGTALLIRRGTLAKRLGLEVDLGQVFLSAALISGVPIVLSCV